MKRFVYSILQILIVCLLVGCSGGDTEGEIPVVGEENYVPLNYETVHALWISQYDMYDVYTSGGVQRNEVSYRTLVRQMMANVVACGFNTVIVQLRPFGDSLYPSALYPPSYIATGAYGRDFGYDPFAILLEEAHAVGLSVHAWLNPLRLMKRDEIEKVTGEWAITAWYHQSYGERVVEVEGRLYLNPAYEDVRSLIADGAAEVVARYEVDGVHLDDYFYPTEDAAFDRLAYALYREPYQSLADFRRGELNKLIAGIYRAVKHENEGVLFGISPGGNMDNTYLCQYADVYTWCSREGYVDYLCPQIYFGLRHEHCDFISTARRWEAIMKEETVALWLGMTFGKIGMADPYAGAGYNEWLEDRYILATCTARALSMPRCEGVAFFSYRHVFDPVSGARVERTYEESEAVFSQFTSTIPHE